MVLSFQTLPRTIYDAAIQYFRRIPYSKLMLTVHTEKFGNQESTMLVQKWSHTFICIFDTNLHALCRFFLILPVSSVEPYCALVSPYSNKRTMFFFLHVGFNQRLPRLDSTLKSTRISFDWVCYSTENLEIM